MKCSVLLFVLALLISSCQVEKQAEFSNTSEKFDAANSDPAAIELADSIMIAVSGRENWEKTRFFSWNAGDRDLYWDKQMGRVRMVKPGERAIYLFNINTGSGKIQVRGKEIANKDSLKEMLSRAKSIFIDDVYGLVLPFKLKDSGAILKYVGEDTFQGIKYNILQITFPKVENTPRHKYKIYVDMKEKVVKYWSYYVDADQEAPTFTRPWDNHQKYGSILLSDDGSSGGGAKSVKVEANLPDKLFTEF